MADQVGFYRCWTQKEAFIKLVGAGLSFPLHAFDVEVDPDSDPALLDVRAPAPDALPCGMALLDVPDGYAGAIAVRGTVPLLRTFAVE